MAKILYEDGKKLGEVSDWKVAQNEPVYKTFLGKTVLSVPANNECSFVSPKPVKRKSKLSIKDESGVEMKLEIKAVVGATGVTAKIIK